MIKSDRAWRRIQGKPCSAFCSHLAGPPTPVRARMQNRAFLLVCMETWKAIPGYEGLYEVSDQGRVRSRKKILALCNVSGGYKAASLGKNNSKLIHRLVAAAFLGPAPSDKKLVLHSNGDRFDNQLSNLRYGSFTDNSADAKLHGTQVKGERQHAAKLTEEQVLYIRASNETGVSLAKKFDVTGACISAIIKRKNWCHV
jgi:hypothetical protein